VPLRSLKDPPSIKLSATLKYPTHMKLAPKYIKLTKKQDRGGVHANSSIPNYVAYLLVNGGEHPSSHITVGKGKLGPEAKPRFSGIGRAKAEQLYYKVLTEYLDPSSNFSDFSDAMDIACEEMRENKKHKINYRDCGRVNNAFAAVGLGEKDTDEDSWEDFLDNCVDIYNPHQDDADGDGVGDACAASTYWGLSERFVRPVKPQVKETKSGPTKGTFRSWVVNQTNASLEYRHVENGEETVNLSIEYQYDKPPQYLRPGETLKLHAEGKITVRKDFDRLYLFTLYYNKFTFKMGSYARTNSFSRDFEIEVPAITDDRKRFSIRVGVKALDCTPEYCNVTWTYEPRTGPMPQQ